MVTSMQGMSERQYAAHVGLSRGAIQKAKRAGRLVLFEDGSIDPARSDERRRAMTDPSQQRRPASSAGEKSVPHAALSAVSTTLRDADAQAGAHAGMSFVQARTANEALKAQERRLRVQRLKGELIDRSHAKSLFFRLAREERDAWVNWPARVAALIAAELGLEPAVLQAVLESHVRDHLDELSNVRLKL
jgi:hypothetical protein